MIDVKALAIERVRPAVMSLLVVHGRFRPIPLRRRLVDMCQSKTVPRPVPRRNSRRV